MKKSINENKTETENDIGTETSIPRGRTLFFNKRNIIDNWWNFTETTFFGELRRNEARRVQRQNASFSIQFHFVFSNCKWKVRASSTLYVARTFFKNGNSVDRTRWVTEFLVAFVLPSRSRSPAEIEEKWATDDVHSSLSVRKRSSDPSWLDEPSIDELERNFICFFLRRRSRSSSKLSRFSVSSDFERRKDSSKRERRFSSGEKTERRRSKIWNGEDFSPSFLLVNLEFSFDWIQEKKICFVRVRLFLSINEKQSRRKDVRPFWLRENTNLFKLTFDWNRLTSRRFDQRFSCSRKLSIFH